MQGEQLLRALKETSLLNNNLTLMASADTLCFVLTSPVTLSTGGRYFTVLTSPVTLSTGGRYFTALTSPVTLSTGERYFTAQRNRWIKRHNANEVVDPVTLLCRRCCGACNVTMQTMLWGL